MLLARTLIASSAIILGVLGGLHLWYTFRGTRLHPREQGVQTAMEQSGLELTRQTTVWRAWTGFNASHSLGLVFFALVYLWLALSAPGVLFGSWFLRLLGLGALAAYAVLSKLYFFRVPYRSVVLATALYTAGLVAALL